MLIWIKISLSTFKLRKIQEKLLKKMKLQEIDQSVLVVEAG